MNFFGRRSSERSAVVLRRPRGQRDSWNLVLGTSVREENFVAGARNEMKIPPHELTAERPNFVHGSLLLPDQPAAYSLQMNRANCPWRDVTQSGKLRG
jgi:hypothetical protein